MGVWFWCWWVDLGWVGEVGAPSGWVGGSAQWVGGWHILVLFLQASQGAGSHKVSFLCMLLCPGQMAYALVAACL